jgi:micrococcal nuclease
MIRRNVLALICIVAAWATPSDRAAAEPFPGPVEATVLGVLDGDTFLAEALRIRGIDAPEKRARCAREQAAAARARDALQGMIGDGPVFLTNIASAKYYGRVLADVSTPEGGAVATRMLGGAFVRQYAGGLRESWC